MFINPIAFVNLYSFGLNDVVDGYVGPENMQFDLLYVIDSLSHAVLVVLKSDSNLCA